MGARTRHACCREERVREEATPLWAGWPSRWRPLADVFTRPGGPLAPRSSLPRSHPTPGEGSRPGLDEGEAILRAEVPVLSGDTPDTLAARVLVEEHRIYPEALRLLASGAV